MAQAVVWFQRGEASLEFSEVFMEMYLHGSIRQNCYMTFFSRKFHGARGWMQGDLKT